MYYIYTKTFGSPRIFVVHDSDFDRFDCINKQLFAIALSLSDAMAIVKEHFIVGIPRNFLKRSYVF